MLTFAETWLYGRLAHRQFGNDKGQQYTWWCRRCWAIRSLWPGPCPILDISIEFEIRPKKELFWFKTCVITTKFCTWSRQCNCRNVCKISLRSVKHILNYSRDSKSNFDRWTNFEFDRNTVSGTGSNQLLSITLLSTQDGGRRSEQGCLQRLFLTSMHVSNGYPRLFDSLQYVGFTGVMCWSVGQYSGRNRAV